MNNRRRRFSRELKLEAVRRVQETGRTQAQVAEEIGVSANTLCLWMKQFQTEKADPFPGKGRQTSQAALISRLRRENERLRKERDFLKNFRLLRCDKRVRYRVINEHVGKYPVGLMCRVLRVSYTGYWCWCRDPVGKRGRANKRLMAQISEVFLESGRTYGSPRVFKELQKRGVSCSRAHVAYLMRKHGLRSRHYKRPRGLTQVDRCRAAAPNLVDQYFYTDRPNSIWMSDITYIPTGEGWVYLAAVMDLCTRKIVGWSLKDTLRTELALEAFDRAAAVEKPGKDVIHHSDRGVQYSSLRYQQRLWRHGMMCSMSGKGNCYDNAVTESFFHTLKVERANWKKYQTKKEAVEDLN